MSQDGRKWAPLNDDKAWIECEPAGMLMRDPFLTKGPDGTWHLLWTWHWSRGQMGGRLKIGHSNSKDLLTWTPQKEIFLFDDVPEAGNAWAPEATWDKQRKEWVIYWATMIKGEAEGHRLYSVTTKDWSTYTPVRLWFDPGFSAIDATLVQDGKLWVMVFKDERNGQKRLLLAFADSPQGPWRDMTKSLSSNTRLTVLPLVIEQGRCARGAQPPCQGLSSNTRLTVLPLVIEQGRCARGAQPPCQGLSGDWVEGPNVTRIGKEWWIYFDHYSKPQYYGAYRRRYWKTFEDASKLITFPGETRHGSVVKIPEKLAKKLQAQRR